MNYLKIVMLPLLLASLGSCNDDDMPNGGQNPLPEQTVTSITGLYVLNEGQRTYNNASIDYLDYKTGVYDADIFADINPTVTGGLGDVANDILIYGSKIYIVVTNSNKVEVLDAHTHIRLGMVNVMYGRRLCPANNKVYVTSDYSDPVNNVASPNGSVVEIDTTSLQITNKIMVGRQPEGVTTANNKLYVATSGWRSMPNYERMVTVIDLTNYQKKEIDVAPNLEKIVADAHGDIYVSSLGNYADASPRLYVIDTKTESIKTSFDISASSMSLAGDTLYIIGSFYNGVGMEYSYNSINVKDETLSTNKFITDGTQSDIVSPYCVGVDPVSRNIYITDAVDYQSRGYIYMYDKNGVKQSSTRTGVIPGNIAFAKKVSIVP